VLIVFTSWDLIVEERGFEMCELLVMRFLIKILGVGLKADGIFENFQFPACRRSLGIYKEKSKILGLKLKSANGPNTPPD
jgi:hypothetical protein